MYKETDDIKIYNTKNYNFVFSKSNGSFLRWGSTIKEDPTMSPGPEILDIEISTICHQHCTFCYKSNTTEGKNMSLETFKEIFNKFDLHNLTQVALGIGSIDSSEYLYPIMEYIRSCGIIPNITVNSFRMKDSDYANLAKLAGAVSVSCYDKDSCFNCVKKLTEAGVKQVNIHKVFSNETYDECVELIDLVKTDERLINLNSVVYLWCKPVGDRNSFTLVKDKDKYLKFVSKLVDSEIRYGADSCTSTNLINCIQKHFPEYHNKVINMIEPCESTLFSYYINVDGFGYPCSFAEKYIQGIDLKKVILFKDVWNNKITKNFRLSLLQNKRECPLFNLKI